MIAAIIFYGLLNCLLGAAVGWLIIVPGQAREWRITLGIVMVGVLVNLAGLIWLGYANVWLGEFAVTGGVGLAFAGLVLFKHPLKAHWGTEG
ncbi:hypothetical protein [Paraburkholderia adhaesiva]|uniref:hypothetical protein n=1 Tax=Paraburkholderia adhaesiva TaxID=2883244 RepID=UPI001F456009|nr:hypothetical protein [Paraburkholderia adhaesiva]